MKKEKSKVIQPKIKAKPPTGVRNETLESFLNVLEKPENPLAMANIKWYQEQCQELQLLRQQNPSPYKTERISRVDLVTYQKL